MSFYQKYDLERLIADGDAKTFRAKENATGQQVFLHLFNPGGEAILAAIKSKLAGAPGRPAWPLLEIGDFAGSPYAVTDVIEPFTTLREWLATVSASPRLAPQPAPERQARPPQESIPMPIEAAGGSGGRPNAGWQPLNVDEQFAKPIQPPGAPKAAPEPGEFTKWFDLPAEKPRKPAAPLRPPEPVSEPGPVRPSQPVRQPEADTFESLFQGGGPARPPEPVRRNDPARPNAPVKQPAADTFENLFGGGGPAQPPAGSPPPGKAGDPHTGEFTRLFGRSPLGEQINIEEEQARAARAAPPENRPFQAPGDFTRMFGPQMQTPGPQAPPPAHRPVSDTASGIFGPLGQQSHATTPSNSAETEPGEYTRDIATPREIEPPAAAQPPAPAPVQPAAKKGLLIGLSIGAGLLVIAIVVVVILALRGK